MKVLRPSLLLSLGHCLSFQQDSGFTVDHALGSGWSVNKRKLGAHMTVALCIISGRLKHFLKRVQPFHIESWNTPQSAWLHFDTRPYYPRYGAVSTAVYKIMVLHFENCVSTPDLSLRLKNNYLQCRKPGGSPCRSWAALCDRHLRPCDDDDNDDNNIIIMTTICAFGSVGRSTAT